MLKRLLIPSLLILTLAGCQSDPSLTNNAASKGYYNRASTCDSILHQLGTDADHINDPGVDSSPQREQLITQYRANGCDK